MRREGAFFLPFVQSVVTPTALWELDQVPMSSIPDATNIAARGPDRNEMWFLSNIYLPWAIDVAAGAATTFIVMEIDRYDGQVNWSTVTDRLTAAANGVISGVISEDFVNPIPYRFDEQPLILKMGAAADTISHIGVYTSATAGPSGPLQRPGSIRYLSVTRDEPEWRDEY